MKIRFIINSIAGTGKQKGIEEINAISNKVDMKQLSQLLNECDSESTVKFNYNWKGGLFVDYGSS